MIWETPADPDPNETFTYTVVLDTTSDFSNAFLYEAITDTTTRIILPYDLHNQRYYIKILARDSHNMEAETETVTFTLHKIGIEDNDYSLTGLNLTVSPNPIYHGTFNMNYALPYSAKVEIEIYNILGQLIKRVSLGNTDTGKHNFAWQDKNLNSGVYFVILKTSKEKIIRKAILVK